MIAYTITVIVVKGLITTTSGVSIALASAFITVKNLFKWARVITGTFALTRIRVESPRRPTILHPGTLTSTILFIKDLVLWAGVSIVTLAAACLTVKVLSIRARIRSTDTGTRLGIVFVWYFA